MSGSFVDGRSLLVSPEFLSLCGFGDVMQSSAAQRVQGRLLAQEFHSSSSNSQGSGDSKKQMSEREVNDSDSLLQDFQAVLAGN